MQNNLHPIFEKILNDFGVSAMIENCSDECERAHQGDLPGEKMGECDICGKKVFECELTNYPLLDNRLLCEKCIEEIRESNIF